MDTAVKIRSRFNFDAGQWSSMQVFVFAVLAPALLTGCKPPSAAVTPTPSLPMASVNGGDWLEVYFTEPGDPNAFDYRGGPDAALAKAVDQARVSVDAAVYDLNLWSLRDAFLDAHRRGLTVRIVVESDNLDEPEIRTLINEGIPVLGDRREGLMHDKFVVLDRREVWTGSMNFTTSDGYLNDNHLVRLRSDRLAENYTFEFEEMFVEDLFGPETRAATPNPIFQVGGVQVETYFSPDDDTEARLVELVNSAQSSVYFLAFSFTSDPIAAALVARSEAGVVVAGVFEESQVVSNIGSEYKNLLKEGIDVRLDSNQRNMHHKVLIIDAETVVIGSYNFSQSAAARNDENTLILYDPQTADQFMQEFRRIFENAHR